MMRLQRRILTFVLLLLVMMIHATEPFFPSRVTFTSQNYYSIFIMDQGKSEVTDLIALLQFNNPDINYQQAFIIANMYVSESMKEGVNHDIAFCQMALETGFLTFGGSVQKHQNNFCGLGATADNVKGECFPDIQTGVRAHIQHLKAYACCEKTENPCIDKRFKYVQRGIAPTIYGLTGKWAADPLYDKKIEGLLYRLFSHRTLMAHQTEFR
jgi:hypothetical protein